MTNFLVVLDDNATNEEILAEDGKKKYYLGNQD